MMKHNTSINEIGLKDARVKLERAMARGDKALIKHHRRQVQKYWVLLMTETDIQVARAKSVNRGRRAEGFWSVLKFW